MPDNFAMGIKDVKGFKKQIEFVVEDIKLNEKRWKEFIITQEKVDFLDYFCNRGGYLGRPWKDGEFYFLLQDKIEEIASIIK